MDASLRSFLPGDREAALTLSRHALARPAEQVGSPLWSSREEQELELASWRPDPEHALRVVEEAGKAAGFGGIEVEDDAVLFGPLVAPTFRGRKLGSTLLDASVELARAEGVPRLQAAVGAHNIGGRLLLERAGFRPLGGPEAVYRLAPDGHYEVEQPPGVTTRPAEPVDLAAVLDLCRECFARSRVSEGSWRRGVERGEVRVAEEDGAAVAVVRIDPGRRRVFHGVTAGARAKGLGGYVLGDALEHYWAEHAGEALRLTVPVENLPASRLYRRLGFAPWLVLQPFELVL